MSFINSVIFTKFSDNPMSELEYSVIVNWDPFPREGAQISPSFMLVQMSKIYYHLVFSSSLEIHS